MWRTKMPERWNYRGGGLPGFTLTELLITIAVIAILASALMPSLGRARLRAKIGKVEQELDGQRGQIEQFYADHDTYPPIGGDAYAALGTLGGKPCTWNSVTGWNNDCPWPTEDRNHNYALDSNEDVGLDGVGGTIDPDGTEGNIIPDGLFPRGVPDFIPDTFAGTDSFGKKIPYRYYPGSSIVEYVDDTGNKLPADYDPRVYLRHDSTATVANPRNIPFYDQYVLYSVGPNGKDDGLRSYDEAAQDANRDGILDFDYRARSSGLQKIESFEPGPLNPNCQAPDCRPCKFLLPRHLEYSDDNFEQFMDILCSYNTVGEVEGEIQNAINDDSNVYHDTAKYFTDQGRKGIILIQSGTDIGQGN